MKTLHCTLAHLPIHITKETRANIDLLKQMANRIQGAETERPPSLPSDYISTRFDSLSTPRRKTSTSMPIRSIENFKQLLHDYSIRASELAIRHIYSFAFFIGLILALVSCFYISLDVENIVGTVLSVFLLHILLANLLNEAGLSRCHLISFVYIAVFTILWGIVAYVQGEPFS